MEFPELWSSSSSWSVEEEATGKWHCIVIHQSNKAGAVECVPGVAVAMITKKKTETAATRSSSIRIGMNEAAGETAKSWSYPFSEAAIYMVRRLQGEEKCLLDDAFKPPHIQYVWPQMKSDQWSYQVKTLSLSGFSGDTHSRSTCTFSTCAERDLRLIILQLYIIFPSYYRCKK